MRKFLLSGMAALALGAMATEPRTFEDWQIVSLSPNGEWGVSVFFGRLIVFNTQTGEKFEFAPSEDDYDISYEEGTGNSVANSGRTVGSTTGSNAAWCENGEWHFLEVPRPEVTNGSNGITPDGLRICGSIGTMDITLEDTDIPMQVPGYWDLQSDGTYSAPKELPYPAYDFTGRVPQYVTASSISADGRVILGQVRDYSGSVCLPIVYTQDDEGNWSYTIYGEDLANPKHLEFPPYPGEAPEQPDMTRFMTEEEYAEYQAAYEQWAADGYDWSNYPEKADYMSEASLDAYNAAMADYEVEYAKWKEQFDAFSDVLEQVFAEGYQFEFNGLFLAPDGKMIAVSGKKDVEDPDDWRGFKSYYVPITFNLENGTSKVYDYTQNVALSGIAADYTLLGSVRNSLTNGYEGKICLPGEDTFGSIVDFIASKDEEIGNWMKETMFHDVESYDPVTYDPIMIEHADFSGIPRCTPDMTIFALTTVNSYDWDNEAYTFAYLIEMPTLGLKNAANADFSLLALRGGDIMLGGNVARVVVADLDGRILFDAAPAADRISTGLPSGIYVVKATASNGETKVVKAAF